MNQSSATIQGQGSLSFAMPSFLLRLEGLALFLACMGAYSSIGASGWLFVALILAPDLSMIGYVRNSRVGALIYNAIHALVLPLAILLAGYFGGSQTSVTLALIWLAHIGMDRTFGYGLKYPTAFKDNHLDRV